MSLNHPGSENFTYDILHAPGPSHRFYDYHGWPLLTAHEINLLVANFKENNFSDPWSLRFVSQLHPRTPVCPVKPDRIDYRVINEWLQICRNLHPDRCKPTSFHVPDLRLIDCKTKRIVPASNHSYVTLSYLWGEGGNEMPFSGRLPLKTPRTIEDALLVTLRLGFQYLWIDRYCINQDNVGETYAQLRLMGSIYRNSELTLIAAAGDDPSYRLPGVGERYRTPLASAQIGNHFLRQTRNISPVVRESRWYSRGWTYQEGILATRRLVFTDDQVYFECHGMGRYEALGLPYEAMHSPASQTFDAKYFTSPPGGRVSSTKVGLFHAGYGSVPDEIYSHISDYSRRQLSHDSDRLKAFLGILEAFETGHHRVRHHWGIPILPASQVSSKPLKSFIFGLSWRSGEDDPPVRYRNLPSWSWSGWGGHVYFSPYVHDEHWLHTASVDVEVQMELRNGSVLSWEAFHTDYDQLALSEMSPHIHISA